MNFFVKIFLNEKTQKKHKKDIYNEKTEQSMLLFGEINDLNFLFFPLERIKGERIFPFTISIIISSISVRTILSKLVISLFVTICVNGSSNVSLRAEPKTCASRMFLLLVNFQFPFFFCAILSLL